MKTENCATCKALVWETDVPTKTTGNCWRCEVRRLQGALRFIAQTCIEDPDTAQFASRVIDGSAEYPKDDCWEE